MKRIRFLVFLLLIFALLLSSCPAGASEKPLTIRFLGVAVLSEKESAPMLKTIVRSTQSGTIVYTLTDTVGKNVVYTETKKGVAAGDEIIWNAPFYKKDMSQKKPIKRLRAAFTMDGKTYTYDLYYNLDAKNDTVKIERNNWFTNNTACSFGPAFRDVRPDLTDEWYTFTPINISYPGRQVFEYIAGNLYVIGQIYVDVEDEDTVVVTYHNEYDHLSGNTKTLSEFFTIFHDLDSVTEVDPAKLEGQRFAFGQPISIEKDLEGDDHVLLFICNRVTFATYVNSSHRLTRYWPDLPERVEKREFMMTMLNK